VVQVLVACAGEKVKEAIVQIARITSVLLLLDCYMYFYNITQDLLYVLGTNQATPTRHIHHSLACLLRRLPGRAAAPAAVVTDTSCYTCRIMLHAKAIMVVDKESLSMTSYPAKIARTFSWAFFKTAATPKHRARASIKLSQRDCRPTINAKTFRFVL
jgi:hypothetical protein